MADLDYIGLAVCSGTEACNGVLWGLCTHGCGLPLPCSWRHLALSFEVQHANKQLKSHRLGASQHEGAGKVCNDWCNKMPQNNISNALYKINSKEFLGMGQTKRDTWPVYSWKEKKSLHQKKSFQEKLW